ncbi:MAG: ATP-binding cassette domain-containing protein [Propioniciclava sp.]|uniref:ATP-binding cassette domain-containing protein n=1 Tax=Propioniciclava sp. TaxID=2038686 RepID=UPI0039E4EC61
MSVNPSFAPSPAPHASGAAVVGHAPDAPVITLRDARVSVVRADTTLLSVPNLALYPGDRVVVTGPSGSGKSMLLSTLTGRWAAGLRFTGERTASFDRVGFVPQRGLDALHPLIGLARQLHRVTGATPARVTEVLHATGLTDPALHRRRPTEMSGGQQQRAAVALAALTRAPLILADEPTSALDHDTRDQVLELLLGIVDADQVLVVATHDGAVAERLATRRIAVRRGVLTELPAGRAREEVRG